MKKIKDRVLAKGEATGHAHKLQHSDVYEVTPTLRMFIVSTEGEIVTHEEHNPIPIAKGKRHAGQKLEYDHFDEEARRVMD